MMTREASVAFAGLGNLGQAMSLNLVDKGWNLKVMDRSERRVEPLVDAGAQPVGASDLADADVICFAVPDDAAIYEILGDGLMERLTPEHTIVVHSTILPGHARRLAADLKARSGARYLDVPVSGGSERARRGELTLLVGGDDEDVAEVRPILDDQAHDLFRVGPVGAGAAAKLANQLIMFSALAGVHEALRLTRASGVADATVLEAVATGTGDTWVGRNWGFFDRVAADYNDAGVAITDRPWSKDLWEVVGAGRDAGLSMPLAGLLAQIVAPLIEDNAAALDDTKGANL